MPCRTEYLPEGQRKQVCDELAPEPLEYVPAAHDKQTLEDEAPGAVAYLPGGQEEQKVLCVAVEYVPDGQNVPVGRVLGRGHELPSGASHGGRLGHGHHECSQAKKQYISLFVFDEFSTLPVGDEIE